jgi:hypothetical protein
LNPNERLVDHPTGTGTDLKGTIMRRGSITDQDTSFVETWENIATRQNAIVRIDARGDERQEVINGRRNFMLTTEERIITEGKVLDPTNNPFKNGDFRPVVVPDSVTVESNPNALSDEEIVQMFSVGDTAWPQLLGTIDSVATLRRMLDLAEGADTLTMKRYREMENRLIEARGGERLQLTTKDEQLRDFLSDKPRGSRANASDGRQNPRRQGGRSSDYR